MRTSSGILLGSVVPFGSVATAHTAAVAPSRIVIVGRTGFVSSSGVAEVFLGCFGTQTCTGTISLTQGHTTLASRRGRLVAADNGALVHIPLDAEGGRLIAHHAVRVAVVVRDAN